MKGRAVGRWPVALFFSCHQSPGPFSLLLAYNLDLASICVSGYFLSMPCSAETSPSAAGAIRCPLPSVPPHCAFPVPRRFTPSLRCFPRSAPPSSPLSFLPSVQGFPVLPVSSTRRKEPSPNFFLLFCGSPPAAHVWFFPVTYFQGLLTLRRH